VSEAHKAGTGKTVRVEDVARVAGVSPITVSRALNTPEKVRPETRQKVEAAVEKTGYVINTLASSLRSGRSSMISVFVYNLRNQHFATAMQGAADALEGSRYHILMGQSGLGGTSQSEMLRSVLPYQPAGLMFMGLIHNRDMRAVIAEMDLPVVELWDYREDPIDMQVGISVYETGRLVAEHFIAQGFRKVAYAGRLDGRAPIRLAGFRDGLAQGDVVPIVVEAPDTQSVGRGRDAFNHVLEVMPDCEAVFFSTDMLAVGGILEARSRGISIPHDIAIAGCGDLEFSRQLHVPLTTVRIPAYEIGAVAGRMIRARLEQSDVGPRRVKLDVTLQVRESSRAA
jgi:LacI family gluconate utilization system Gnt-I transcriptional repressor